jgi:hypothetical protein
MLSTKTRTAIATLTTLAALAFPVSALALEPLQWITDNNGSGATYEVDKTLPQGAVTHGQQPFGGNPALWFQNTYSLASEFKRQGNGLYQDLIYGNETFGVDLNWYTPTFVDFYRAEWQFVRQPVSHATAGIPATEQVALYDVASEKYLMAEYEEFGIDLIWTNTPIYQWQVAVGVPNPTTGYYRTGLYNTAEHGYLIEHTRTWGVDLSWDHAPFSLPNGYQAPKARLVISQPVRPIGVRASR